MAGSNALKQGPMIVQTSEPTGIDTQCMMSGQTDTVLRERSVHAFDGQRATTTLTDLFKLN